MAMSLKLAQYQDKALATMNPDLTEEQMALNSLTGITDEICELRNAVFACSLIDGDISNTYPINYKTLINRSNNIVEELGDLMWYLAALDSCIFGSLGTKYPFCPPMAQPHKITAENEKYWDEYATRLTGIWHSMTVELGVISGLMKKRYFQGHPESAEYLSTIDSSIANLVVLCAKMASLVGYDIDYVCERNIKKLNERYPTGTFTAEDSINRKA